MSFLRDDVGRDLRTMIDAARVEATTWAQRLLARSGWVILDTETTGLGPEAQVCQIGVLGADGRVLLDALVQPTLPIPPEATAVHGIAAADVLAAARFDELWPAIEALCFGRTVVIYNADYDLRLLLQSGKAVGITKAHIWTWECAMLQYAKFVGDWSSRHQSFRWPRLPALPGESAHSAIADCRATLAVIRRMAEAEGAA